MTKISSHLAVLRAELKNKCYNKVVEREKFCIFALIKWVVDSYESGCPYISV